MLSGLTVVVWTEVDVVVGTGAGAGGCAHAAIGKATKAIQIGRTLC
nr:hypothetical protein [Mycobacterium kubicae]